MFTLIDRNSEKMHKLGNDFPKYDDVKHLCSWEQYVELIKHHHVDDLILEYKTELNEVTWVTRGTSEFHKVTKDQHIKIGFFSLDALMRMTKDLTYYELATLLRHRVTTDDKKTAVYVLE